MRQSPRLDGADRTEGEPSGPFIDAVLEATAPLAGLPELHITEFRLDDYLRRRPDRLLSGRA